MNTPLVCNELREMSLAGLKSKYGVKSSARVGDRFFSLNYDQIESKPGALVNQCRGLILGVESPLTAEQITGGQPVGNTSVLARPMDRFFNHGDPNAEIIDMESPKTRFYEKLDGTCCILWWNPQDSTWQVGTRSVPTANVTLSGWGDLTFRGLFEKALFKTLERANGLGAATTPSETFLLWTYFLNKSNTYVFELTSPENRIVVEYRDSTVTLLAIRNTATGEETDLDTLGQTWADVPVCPSYKLSSLAALVDFVGSRPPYEQEGIVVRNGMSRVKVKSLAYMAYNRVRDSAANSPRALMELILCEKLDDVLPMLADPDLVARANKMADKTRELFRSVDEQYTKYAAIAETADNPRKAFALAVQADRVWMTPLMNRYLRRCGDFSSFVKSQQLPDGSYSDSFLDALVSMTNV